MKDKMAEREKEEKEMALKDPESRLEQRVKNKNDLFIEPLYRNYYVF